MAALAVILVILASSMGQGLVVGLGVGLNITLQSIVRDEVTKAVQTNPGLAAGLLRMHFHDCFVRGCDGSVLIDSTTNPPNTAEKDAPPNNPRLRGFEVIDNAKERIEAACPRVVSCADVLAFAARDSVVATNGPSYDVPCGRRDGNISLAAEAVANLPPPFFNVSQLTQSFAGKGLTQDEMVTLSGAHTIGRSHCSSFSSRLYNFNGTGNPDPSLDPAYVQQLKQSCPQGSTDTSLVVPLDPISPNVTDNAYYRNVLNSRGLFTSDQALLTDPNTRVLVSQNAFTEPLWRTRFAAAMVKMGAIDILTGDQGEIRLNCRKIN
ncbi:hypothetical protein ACLOJK_032113 [Asimina triloba]